MIINLPQVVPPRLIASINAALASEAFDDAAAPGPPDPGGAGRRLALPQTSATGRRQSDLIAEALFADRRFVNQLAPKRLSSFRFLRYEAGMAWPEHVSPAHVHDDESTAIRVDLSLTLFLSDPRDYDGGELVVVADDVPQPVKLPAGDLVAHRGADPAAVTPVTRGSRSVASCAIESLVRGSAERRILADIGAAMAHMNGLATTDRPGLENASRLLDWTRNNLVRMWGEP